MITELNKRDFSKISHITDRCNNIEVRAIVSGNNPGWVYVDHPSEPTAALVWIQGQKGFHMVGDAHSKSFWTGLEPFVTQHIEPRLREQNVNWVEISVETDSWDEAIQDILHNRNLSKDIQHVFTLRENIVTSEIREEQIMVQRLDKDLLNSKELDNYSFLEDKIHHFWDSIDSFLQKGFGYIAVHNNNVVSLCFSAFVADQTHAIDIETLEGYKRNHYSIAVARAFVEECKLQGIQPYWDCSPDNAGSIRVAKSVGLSPYFDYRIYWYKFS